MGDSSSDRDPIEVLAEEFMERKRRGENPTLREYEEKYPELAADIRDLFPALVVIEDLKPASEAGDATNGASSGGPRIGGMRQRELGDYRILREVGRGGMGVVYEAEQVSLGRHVALKVLPQQSRFDSKQRYRFEREARAAARLHHTNIVPIFGVGEQDGMLYYVMQYIQGLGLDEVLEELKRMRIGQATGTPAPDAGEIRVSRREINATQVAHSLVTGRFEKTDDDMRDEEGNGRRKSASPNPGAPTLATAPSPPRANAPQHAVTEELDATCAHEPAATANAESVRRTESRSGVDRSAVASRLSDSFSLSSSTPSLTGHSESRGKRRAKHTYWHSVANIGAQVADAMEYAHNQGVLHRDIKPSNLLLDTRGTVWVTDFGLAKADDQQNLTHTGDILGTLRYMPPEAFEGKSDRRGDVYSLGLTLYELVAMRPAFDESDRHRLIKQVTTGEPVRLNRAKPDAPRDLITIIHKAIEREPHRRYASAGEMAADLARFIDDEPIKARRANLVERAVRWARHNRAIASLTAAIAVMLLVAAVASSVAAVRMNLLAETRQAALDEVVVERDAKQDALGAAEIAKEHAQQLAADNRRGLVRFNAEHGAELLEHGDPFSALPWFAEALALDNDVDQAQLHRVRLATTLRHAPKLLHCWTTRPGTGRVSFSPDGAHLAVTNTRLSNWVQNRETTWRNSPVYLWDVATGAATTPLAHDRAVFTTAFSPKGDRLATVGLDELARIWDPKTGKMLRSFKVQQPSILFAAFSPDGQRLLTGGSTYSYASEDLRVQVWDAQTGVRVLDLVHPYAVLAAAFSPDGRRIATASGALVHVWDATNGSAVGSPHRGIAKVVDVAFAADGQSVVAIELDGSIRMWDVHSGQALPAPRANDVSFRALSSDRRRAASVSRQGNSFQVWDLTTGQPLTRPLEHELEITEIAFSDDGRLVASAGRDRAARVWVAESGRLLAVLRHASGVMSTAFHPQGRMVATLDADGQVRVWDLAGMEPTMPDVHHDAYVHHVAFAPDGRYFVTASADGTARLWDGRTGKPHGLPLRHERSVVHAAFSHNGNQLVTASDDHAVRVWDVETGKPRLARPLLHDGGVNFAEFSADGKMIVTASDDTAARLWNAATGEPVGEPMRHRGRVISARFSPDGNWIVTASTDKKARIWDARTGKARTDEIWHAAAVSTAMFTPDGRAVLTASAGTSLAAQQARLWDAGTGRPLGPPMSHADGILDAAIVGGAKGSGEWLIATGSSDSTARIWNGRTGAAITAPLRHESHVVGVTFSPDGRRLATASRDGKVRVFDVRTGILVTPPLPHGNLLTRVAFHPSGDSLAAASVDGRVQIWNLGGDDRAVDEWRAVAGVLSGQRLDERGAALPAIAASAQKAWEQLPAAFRGENKASEVQIAAWSESLLTDARRSQRSQQARIAAEKAAGHLEAGEWDACVEAYRKAVELSRADYDFPVLNTIARVLNVPLAIGGDPQDLLKKLDDAEPRFVTLWLDEGQVQERPANAGLNASRQIALGINTANESNGAGVRITGFRNFSRGERAGLQVGDLVTHVDGVPIGGFTALRRAIATKRLGQSVAVRVSRGAIVANVQVPVVAELLDTFHQLPNSSGENVGFANPDTSGGMRPLFGASSRRGRTSYGAIRDGRRTQHVFGVPRESILSQLESLPDGYVPIWMHVDGVGAEQRWTAIWAEDEGKRPWRQHDRLSLAELRQQLGLNAASGFRPIALCGYGTVLGETLYWAVWVKDATPNRVALRQNEAELRAELAGLPKNWRPERIFAYREGDKRFFNAIFIEDPAITRWTVHLNVPEWAAQMHYDKLSRERYLLIGETIDTASTMGNTTAAVEFSERGKALADAGELETAAQAFVQASEAARDDAGPSLDLARVRVRQLRWDDAAAALRERFRRLAAAQPKSNADSPSGDLPFSAATTWERMGWSVTGPYAVDDDGAAIVAAEARPDGPPRATEPVAWSTLTNQTSDNLNLDARYDSEPGVYYARQYVYSEHKEQVVVQVGRDAALRVWLNGNLVHEGAEAAPADAPLTDVTLRPGWNTFVARLVVPRKHQLLARWFVEPASLAGMYEAQQRYKDAWDAWSKVVSRQPKYHFAWISRARAAAKLKRYAEAIADFQKALELRPNDAGLRYEMTLIYADWSASLAADQSAAQQRGELADHAVDELRRTLDVGPAALQAIQNSIFSEPRLASLTKRRDFQDLLLRAVDRGDQADVIYHRFADMGGGYWASNQSLQSILDVNEAMTKQESRPHYITANQQTDGPTFAACWQSDGKSFRTNAHATWDDVERTRRELAEVYLPTSIDAYRFGNELRWMAVWTREDTPTPWRLDTELSREALTARLKELKTQRFRPTLINSYTDLQDRLRFAAVWVQDQAECDAYPKLTADEVRKKLDALPNGWRPLWLEGYIEDDQRYVAAIFINDGKSPEWKVATAQPSTAVLSQIREIRYDRFWAVQQSLTIDPTNPQALLRRVELLTQYDRRDDAEAELTRGIARMPDRVELYSARAALRSWQGRFAEASADYASALKLKPDDETIRVERGRLAAYGHLRVVVPTGSTWKWFHPRDGVDPAVKEPSFRTTFFQSDYDDSHWKAGRDAGGGFGYGETVGVNIGMPPSGKRLTAYFRHRFTTEEPLHSVTLSCQRDDGIVVYLDGVEVARDNMTSGLDTFEARADISMSEGPDEERTITIPLADKLAAGKHVLAISLHNQSSRSGDLRIANIEVRAGRPDAKPQDVHDPQLLADRGLFYLRQHDFVKGEADLSAALKLVPDNARAALLRGRFLDSQNRWREAIADYDVAIRQRADDAQLFVERAMLHARLGARSAALGDLTQATKLRPDDVSFRRQQGQLYAILDGNVIVPTNSRWRWLHPVDGVDPATSQPNFHTSFFKAEFDDSAWREDPDSPGESGGFGYGQKTRVDIGTPSSGNRFSAYFRHKFTTDAAYDSLNLSLRRDDAVIVYLDGVEVARDRFKPGPDDYRLFAADSVTSPTRPRSISIPRVLPPGEHVLAISLHNINASSSDLVLGGVTLLGSRREVAETALDDLEALSARADTFVQLGHLDRALMDWTRMIAVAPDDMQPLLKRAEAYYQAERWNEALVDYTRLAERFEPRNLNHYYRRQLCLNRLRRFEESRSVINEALKVVASPAQRGEYLALRAYTSVLEGRSEQAANDYVQALAAAPTELHVNHVRDAVTTFAAAGRMDLCVQSRDQLLERLARGETSSAQEELRALLVAPLSPEQIAKVDHIATDVITNYGGVWAGVYYRTGRFQEALDRLDESTAYFTEYRFARPLILLRLGQVEKARAALAEANARLREEEAATAPGELPHFAHDWQRILTWRREATEAIIERPLAELARAMEAEPDNVKLRAERGRLALALGKDDEALADLNLAITAKGDDALAYAGRGDLFAKQKKWDAAAADYLAAVRLDPLNADLLARLDKASNQARLATVAADAEREPVSWRRMLTRPEANWAASDYDDQAWETAPGPFGSSKNAWDRGRTAWTTSDIWLRREFQVAQMPKDLLVVRAKFDDAIEVYINGVRALESTAWGDYHVFACNRAAARALRTGRNVLAVHCRNRDGAGFIDVGLYDSPGSRKLLTALDELIAQKPQGIELLAKRCGLLAQLERWDSAVADAVAIRAQEPKAKGGDYWNGKVPSQIAGVVASQGELFQRFNKLQPGDYFVLVARAKQLAADGRWKEAAPVMAAALDADPDDSMGQATYARVLAQIGDIDAYRRARDALLTRYRESDHVLGVYAASQACVLLDDEKFDWNAALAIAQRSDQLGREEKKVDRDTRQPTRNLVLALAHLRLGHVKEADAAVQLALDESRSEDRALRRATCLAVRAMICQKENKAEEARQCLAEADTLVQAARSAGEVRKDWREWLRYDVLRRQATQMLSADAPR